LFLKTILVYLVPHDACQKKLNDYIVWLCRTIL